MLTRARTIEPHAGRGSQAGNTRPAGASAAATAGNSRAAAPLSILLTGASTGLGLAIGKLLLQTPHRLVLTARASALPRFAEAGLSESPRTWVRALDVTREEERRAVVGEMEERWGGVDVLINNAAVAYRSVTEHASAQEWEDCLQVNFHAPMHLTRLVLPSMRAKRAGRILNISSVGGMMAMPTMCLYSASKFALEGATEALWYEVRPWGIQVSLIQPGFIHSGSFHRTRYTVQGQQAAQRPSDPYHTHYVAMSNFIGRLMDRAWATPETIAKVVLKTMQRKHAPLRVPATWDAHLFSLLRRVLPRVCYHALLYRNLPSIREWGKVGEGRAPVRDQARARAKGR